MPDVSHYIIVADNSDVKRVLKLLRKFEREDKIRVNVIAIYVTVKDARILGGIKRGADNVLLLKGVLIPSVKV